ncbi:MAG: DNA polymerase III subunit alpha, partial [Candidatus Omnitrophica bacterium]|nr:DNA polymerase III subunit alpha [Candidatus Omnitrophota bacterium]
VMAFSYGEIDKVAKMIHNAHGAHVTLKEAIDINPDLAAIYNNDSGIKRVIDVSMRLEGLSRHASIHAAGVVISDKPVTERVPVIRGNDGEQIAAYDMSDIEKCGMLKMDFLGLKTLTLIDETLKIIKRTKNVSIDISKIRLDDEKTFELFGRGDTVGVFQLESRGMREILMKMQPSRFEDIIAVLALYRPGPLGSGMVEDFILRKQGAKPIAYPHPKLENILKETYGVILYQEQTMQIAAVLAGFDMAQADTLRKAIGKKITSIMEKQREQFMKGSKANGIDEKRAEQIFDLIEYFGGYGFNKSHSAAYALISYQTAYLKANFPVEFMAAVLTSERNDTDKIVQYINELRYMKINILPPDINTSYANFTVIDDNSIRFGLIAIKNVGGAALKTIIDERKTSGSYKDFFEFCDRMPSRTVNKKVMESLIKSGAMDSLGLKRSQMFAMLDSVLARSGKKSDPNQLMFFAATVKQPIPEIEEWPFIERLRQEKMLLGIYVTGHPLETYKMLTGRLARRKINNLLDSTFSGDVTICGVIDKAKMLLTKRNNSRMAILSVEDETSSIETVVFPKLFEEKGFMVSEGAIVVIRGKADRRDQVLKILAEDIIPIEQLKDKLKEVSITIPKDKELLMKLKAVISGGTHTGGVPVILSLKDKIMMGIRIRTDDKFLLDPTEENLKQIAELVGKENLLLRL